MQSFLQTKSGVALVFALYALGLTTVPAAAQSAGCNRARAITDEVRAAYDAGTPDHRAALEKLRTAQQLCPTLADAWKLAYCSALAIGDQEGARRYRDRAVFNGASDLDCGDVAAAPAASSPLSQYVHRKFALVIGVGEFRDPAITPLQYAAKDAADFAATLRDPRYGNFAHDDVILLTNKEATRAAILNAIQQIFVQSQEDDLVVTYVSSHGLPERAESGLGGIGYIVTYDTSLKTPWLDAIEYQNFAENTSRITARRKVTFLDTCFSGLASRKGSKALSIEGVGVDERTAKKFISGEGTFVITSSKATERSWESDAIQNSFFTYYLIDAFKQAKTPPTVREIFDHVSKHVADAVARDKQAPQHPQMQPLTGPLDLRIGVVPTGSASHP